MPASTKDMNCNSFHPSDHLGGCTTRECQEHDSPGIGPIYDEVCDTISQGIGLARSRPRYDDERQDSCPGRCTTVFYGSALFRIEHSEIEVGHGRGANHLCSMSKVFAVHAIGHLFCELGEQFGNLGSSLIDGDGILHLEGLAIRP